MSQAAAMSVPRPIDISPPVHRIDPSISPSLDTTVFRRSVPVLAARIPAVKTSLFTKQLPFKRFCLDIPKIRTAVPDPQDASKRLILLNASKEDQLPADIQDIIHREAEGLTPYSLELDYSYWSADEILHAVLPEEFQDAIPSSFTMTGHIAHFNLRDEYLPYKYIIGQIILDKHPMLRTVVNKLDSIDTEFRFFKMEVIAGEPDFIVEAHESNCRFTFDFSQVYWNSRLHSEHERLVNSFKPTDVVADVFGGVGPFAVPAAKKGCAVFGNDLNPNSAKYMEINAKQNNVASRVRVSCKDGREFIREVVNDSWRQPFPAIIGPVKTARQLEKEARHKRNIEAKKLTKSESPAQSFPEVSPPPRRRIDHFVMNLPGTALEFLDAFQGILSSVEDESVYDVMPLVHVHCFTRELEREKAEGDIRQRAETALGASLEADASYHFVRSVAPNKDMYCLTFRLPRGVAMGK